MISRRRAAAALLVAAAWVLALALPQSPLRSIAGFLAIFLAPGMCLDRALGDGRIGLAERPARALALSIGMVGILASACTWLGLSIHALNVALAAATLALAFCEPAGRARTGGSAFAEWTPAARAAAAAVIGLAAAATMLAALAPNIARDRMWYAAYVTQLSVGGALDWREPMLGSGHVVWRFAHNAWLAALAAWRSVAGIDAPYLLERVAPPLLVAVVPSSSLVLARTLWRNRGEAAVAALCTLVVLLASPYPYFSPERYAFFARIVEDKTAALVLLAPVALAFGVDALAAPSPPRAHTWARLTLALLATALTHAIVYLLACVAFGAFAAVRLAAGRCGWRTAVAALTIAAAVALAPATLGFRARHDVLAVAAGTSAEVTAEHADDPIVRAHLRMHRLRDVSIGGPTVDPALLADPLLLFALLGLVPSLIAWRSPWGAYLSAVSLACLALAFLPFLAPAFGRLVVPWMAYRALWGVPFGLLLGAVTIAVVTGAELSELGRTSTVIAVAVLVALVLLGAKELPWRRTAGGQAKAARLAAPADARPLLAAIATLPTDTRVAAAPGIAELIPAYAGRAVLALSDRATVAFAESRAVAEERLIANAAIVALHGAHRRLRDALIASHRVTHVVYEAAGCDLAARAVFSNARYTLCEIRRPGTKARPALRQLARAAKLSRATAAFASRRPALGRALATLEHRFVCRPRPIRDGPALAWRRQGRWSGAFVSVDCSVRFGRARRIRGLVVRGYLPRAREALIVNARASSGTRRCVNRTAVVELTRDQAAALDLRCKHAREVRVRLVPAFLPYLNLRELELR